MSRTVITGSSWLRAVTYTPQGGGRGRVVLETAAGHTIEREHVPSWMPGLIAAGWPGKGSEPSSPGRAVNRFLLRRRPKPAPANPWTTPIDRALAARRRLVAERREQSPWTRRMAS